GLERAAWSKKTPLEQVVMTDRWPSDEGAPQQPVSHLRSPVHGPQGERLVSATDAADELLSPPESLGVLDRALNWAGAVGAGPVTGGTLVLAGTVHPDTDLGVSAFPASSTADVLTATVEGTSLGSATATGAGLAVIAADAGVRVPVPGARAVRRSGTRGDPVTTDAMTLADVETLVAAGREIGTEAATTRLVCLGEVGVGNTTVAATLACALLDLEPQDAVGLGSGSDADMVAHKRHVVASALTRTKGEADPLRLLAAV